MGKVIAGHAGLCSTPAPCQEICLRNCTASTAEGWALALHSQARVGNCPNHVRAPDVQFCPPHREGASNLVSESWTVSESKRIIALSSITLSAKFYKSEDPLFISFCYEIPLVSLEEESTPQLCRRLSLEKVKEDSHISQNH